MKKYNSRKCPLCKKTAKNWFIKEPSYWYCRDCNLAWIKKVPNIEYDDNYYIGKSSVLSSIFAPIEKTFYKIRSMYAGNSQKKVWVDVGAGDGGFLTTVNAKRKIGVEYSFSGRKIMEESGLETLSDKQFLRRIGLNADIISFWHVLEHVPEPWDYLVSAKRNLKSNGKIVVGIPNIDSLEFNFTREYWFHLQPQFHLWHFSPNSLKKILEQTGFSIKSVDHWSIEHHPTGILQSFINKTSDSKENVLHKLMRRGTGKSATKAKDLVWSLFWMTIGMPIIFSFWVLGSLFRKAATIVVVASPTK